jgi:hypothetical protein
MDYWKEAFAAALEEADIPLPGDDKLKLGAEVLEGAHENYGMAFYSPPAGEHLRSEIDSLKRELRKEREKEHCRECDGRGSITTPGPYHSSTSRCWKCNGEGRVAA